MKNLKQQANPNSNSLPNFIFYSFLILSLSVSFTTLVLLKNTDTSYIKTLGKNWNSSPLSLIDFSKNTCKENENIISNFWQGPSEACNCDPNANKKNIRSNISYPKTIRDGKCLFEMLTNNACKTNSSTPKIPYKVWNGNYMCAQKTKLNYFESELVENIEDCGKMNMKPCGKIDTYNNVLCVAKNSNCPINYSENIPLLNLNGSKTKSKNLLQNFSMNFSSKDFIEKKRGNKMKSKAISDNDKNSNKINFIPVEFIVESSLPCAYKGKNQSKSFPFSNSESDSGTECQEVFTRDRYDLTYNKLDSMKKSLAFKENNITRPFENKELSQKEKNNLRGDISLFSRSFIGLKKNCFDKIKKNGTGDILISNLLTSDDMKKEFISFLQICLFIGLLSLFLNKYFIQGLWKKGYYLTLIIFHTYFSIIFFTLNYYLLNLLLKTKFSGLNGISQIVRKNCMDELTYYSVRDFYITINNSIFLVFIVLVTNSILLINEIYNISNAFIYNMRKYIINH